MNAKVDFYFNKPGKWHEELFQLRKIVLSCGLSEELKWGVPCYTHEGRNVVLLHTFKEYCAILFFKGALLADPQGILVQQTKNVQAARQVRFTSPAEVNRVKKSLKTYIIQALEIEKKGLKVEMKSAAEFEVAPEFARKLEENKHLKQAFDALTPGRRKAYLLYFSSAKQDQTRTARVEKSIPAILAGRGLDD